MLRKKRRINFNKTLLWFPTPRILITTKIESRSKSLHLINHRFKLIHYFYPATINYRYTFNDGEVSLQQSIVENEGRFLHEPQYSRKIQPYKWLNKAVNPSPCIFCLADFQCQVWVRIRWWKKQTTSCYANKNAVVYMYRFPLDQIWIDSNFELILSDNEKGIKKK